MFETVSSMASSSVALEATRTLESGTITFLSRPREESRTEELGDVQRLLLRLAPEGSPFERLIIVGRRRLPSSAPRDRFWGFVDLVLTPNDMEAALDTQVYGSNSDGMRPVPAARAMAQGTYEVEQHHSHAHLRWSVDPLAGDDPVAALAEVENSADYIVTVANPDPHVWGLLERPPLQTVLFDDLELHVPLPAPFPPGLRKRLGSRRYAQLDSIDWLDHPGAELLFSGAE